jgi:predicted Zn-dependent protease
MRERNRVERSVGWLAPLAAIVVVGCSLNPATGKRQLVLIGESQEIAMGLEAHSGIVEQMGRYDDDEWASYVSEVGKRLAASSERPNLPWNFEVIDDPVVNAFALPGGYLYLTRGILAHFSSEAEMAGVLGHEIGHVTARHGVNQMSKGMLAQIGLGVGSVVSPEVAALSGLAESGVGLLFLKYGRDDERQADDLGLRYLLAEGYEPSAMMDVFSMLERVSSGSEGGRMPAWMSTHPPPEARLERMAEALAASDLEGGRVERDSYLQRLDGLVYGQNPRQGYFRADRFIHPEMAFELTFPEGWKHQNQRAAVVSLESNRQAAIVLRLAGEEDAAAAARQFFESSSVERGQSWRAKIGGRPAVSAFFRTVGGETEIRGIAAFVEHGEQVFALLGYTPAASFEAQREPLTRSLASFRPVKDRRLLAVQPLRLQTYLLSSAATPRQLAEKSPVGADVLARLNNVGEDVEIPAGTRVKTVAGELPPG